MFYGRATHIKMKIGIISDTHGMHDQVRVPPCDVLIHAGDCTNDAGQKSLRDFLTWFERQPAEHKILIAGNHDWAFEKWPELSTLMVKEMAPSVTYLQDSGHVIDDVVFWGSPMSPRFFDWAFNRDRGPDIKRHWDLIPDNVDVLVTHGPVKGFLDFNSNDKFHCGCEDLLNRVLEVNPKLHCCGHIHEGYGQDILNETVLVNASVVTRRYIPSNAPIIYDLAT